MASNSSTTGAQIPIIIKRPGAGSSVGGAGAARLPGVHPSTRYGQQVVSSGIPSLDTYLGNGFPIGSIVIIKDAFPSQYADMILKCFIAEGATYNHHVFVCSEGSVSSSTFAAQLPSLVKQESSRTSDTTSIEADNMRIAWRYKDASPLPATLSTRGLGVASSNKLQQKLASKFEFTKKTTAAELGCKHLTLATDSFSNNSMSSFDPCSNEVNLLSEIVTVAKQFDQTDNTKRTSNFLRIALSHCEHQLTPSFMQSLRALVRHTTSCAVLTISDLTLDPSTHAFAIEHFADYVIQVQGIVDDTKKKQFGDNIDGVCDIKKLDVINSNKPMWKTKDLGFSFRKKRFTFQELHLQPEDDTTAQRETSNMKMASTNILSKESKSSCGGGGSTAKGKSIDF